MKKQVFSAHKYSLSYLLSSPFSLPKVQPPRVFVVSRWPPCPFRRSPEPLLSSLFCSASPVYLCVLLSSLLSFFLGGGLAQPGSSLVPDPAVSMADLSCVWRCDEVRGRLLPRRLSFSGSPRNLWQRDFLLLGWVSSSLAVRESSNNLLRVRLLRDGCSVRVGSCGPWILGFFCSSSCSSGVYRGSAYGLVQGWFWLAL